MTREFENACQALYNEPGKNTFNFVMFHPVFQFYSDFLAWQPRCQSYYRALLIVNYIVPESFYKNIL